MPPEKRKQSSTNRNSDPPSDSNDDPEKEKIFNGSGSPEIVSDGNLLKNTDDISAMLRVDVDDPFCKVCREHEIRSKMAKYLPELVNFKIVCVCDDSGSMNTTSKGSDYTRWKELCRMMKIIVKIGIIFNPDGIDIYFLNRQSIFGVKDLTAVDQAFQMPPSGYTPLVPKLDEIFEKQSLYRESNRKLLVIIATDGEPTNDDGDPNVPELEHLMRHKRDPAITHVSFLVCTDDRASVDYLRKWDDSMENVDVTDQHDPERDRIRQCQRNNEYPFSFGDYIVKIMVGAFVPAIDQLDYSNT